MRALREQFGTLRALLNRPPDEAVWAELCALLFEVWQADFRVVRDQWLPYTERALERWPDDLRVCPEAWLDHLADRDYFLPITLTRTVHLTRESALVEGTMRAIRQRKYHHAWTCAQMSETLIGTTLFTLLREREAETQRAIVQLIPDGTSNHARHEEVHGTMDILPLERDPHPPLDTLLTHLLFGDEPTPLNWAHVRDLLDARMRGGAAYDPDMLEDGLERWPDHLRVASAHMVERAARGEVVPALPLCRALHITEWPLTPERASRLCAAPSLFDSITCLILDHNAAFVEGDTRHWPLETLALALCDAEEPVFPNMHTLELRGAHDEDTAWQVFGALGELLDMLAMQGAVVHTLAFDGGADHDLVSARALVPLLGSDALAPITTLVLRSCTFALREHALYRDHGDIRRDFYNNYPYDFPRLECGLAWHVESHPVRPANHSEVRQRLLTARTLGEPHQSIAERHLEQLASIAASGFLLYPSGDELYYDVLTVITHEEASRHHMLLRISDMIYRLTSIRTLRIEDHVVVWRTWPTYERARGLFLEQGDLVFHDTDPVEVAPWVCW